MNFAAIALAAPRQLAPIRLSLFNDNQSSKALPGEIKFRFPAAWLAWQENCLSDFLSGRRNFPPADIAFRRSLLCVD